MPVCTAGPIQARPPQEKDAPSSLRAPGSLPLSAELRQDAPGGYRQSQSGAQCVRQAALRSPAERARDTEPWPARGTQAGCQTETPRLHVSTVFRAVSGSSLLLVPRSSPATQADALTSEPPGKPIMRNAGLHEAQAGIKSAGRNINSLRYADDTTLTAILFLYF